MTRPPRPVLALLIAASLAAPAPAQPQGGPGKPPRIPPPFDELGRAAASWERRRGPERRVVDQVCLVPDVATFLEAIATWDDRHAFPILIDDIELSFKFLRAFRPSRVVRLPRKAEAIPPDQLWARAVSAVERAWGTEAAARPSPGSPVRDAIPRAMGNLPPGIVLSEPDSPMLAGAVALAAGRFQPLVRWAPLGSFADIVSADEARVTARTLAAKVAESVASYDRLGDDCDFITLAGDWPFRYEGKAGASGFPGIDRFTASAPGPFAFDDLVGRSADGRSRWAFAGRLLGDAKTSVYRAMCSLFLPPRSALLVNTYDEKAPGWSDYAMGGASRRLERILPVTYRSGAQADLAGWHRAFDPVNRRGLVMINSHGGTTQFHVTGGTAVTGDVPATDPAAVVMIHSFSAADPADPRTIAGRWLANGAFIYYGSMHEPGLQSFRPPELVAVLIEAGLPLGAALRQSAPEGFGGPWRLVYLGDPLYRVRRGDEGERVPTSSWAAGASWPRYEPAPAPDPGATDDEKLRWAVRAAVAQLRRDAPAAEGEAIPGLLLAIRRPRLAPPLRPFHDALLADAMLQRDRVGELRTQLVNIPPAERTADVARLLETCQFQLLERAVSARQFVRAEGIWSELIRSDLPREVLQEVTARVATLADSPVRRGEWRALLASAGRVLKASPAGEVVEAERKRVEALR